MTFTCTTDEDPIDFLKAIVNTIIGGQHCVGAKCDKVGDKFEITIDFMRRDNVIIDGKPLHEQLPYPKPGEYLLPGDFLSRMNDRPVLPLP